MKLLLFFLFVGTTVSYRISNPNSIVKDDADIKLSVPELITKYGYPVETYQLETSDGYLLTVHRIPHGKNGGPDPNKKVLLLQHGLLSSSADWIITGPERGLGYMMADAGYDVWLGNARGNAYSRNHTTLNPDKDSAFWQFSWHQIGTIDLPKIIDFMLETTGVEQIYYAGHSQGTTAFYVMGSERPEYNDKIKIHVSLAPIAYMNHMTSPLLKIMSFWSGTIETLLGLIGVNEFLPNNDFMSFLGSTLCDDDSFTEPLCSNALFAICGFSNDEMDNNLLPVLMGHTPAGSSTKQLLHYSQEISSGHFRQYDFGMLGNLNKYGSMSPPEYSLAKVTAPVFLIYSRNDWLSAETDVIKLCNQLGKCMGKYLITDDFHFNHLDYMYGIHAPEYIYKKYVIYLMSKY